MAKTPKSVETITHKGNTRTNIPTAEYENFMQDEVKKPVELKYPRNPDSDPQLVWRGKDEQDWSDLVVTAPPLYIQEKINPKHIIDDLMRQSKKRSDDKLHEKAPDLFPDMFDGELDPEAKTEFYTHDQNWTNRMILGDSLQVMASLAEREGLRGKVQCIYFDPPYGIKFGSNWQVSTKSRDVKDNKADQISREPEMVKAFRDTWSDGIHSYLTYLRDRLTIARDLLNESGSIFVQIGDDNLHIVRNLLDEIFGQENFVAMIAFSKSGGGLGATGRIPTRFDYLVWYAKRKQIMFYQPIFEDYPSPEEAGFTQVLLNDGSSTTVSKLNGNIPHDAKVYLSQVLTKPGPGQKYEVNFQGKIYTPGNRWWGTKPESMDRVIKANRVLQTGSTIRYKRYFEDFPVRNLSNLWDGLGGAIDKYYVVQTSEEVVRRAISMVSNPGDLVLDPTCGSGTTAKVSEEMGRRWITIDTSRVSLALARTRMTASKYPSYLLADSESGQKKIAELTGKFLEGPTFNNIRQGFVYHQKPRITLRTIANNLDIDVIWDSYAEKLQNLRQHLNSALNLDLPEWEILREIKDNWPEAAKIAYGKWKDAYDARQREIDASIARNAEIEYLYDRPYVDNSKVRVAGPFTVESLSPHKVIAVDDDGEFLDNVDAADGLRAVPDRSDDEIDFSNVILEHLRTAGVQQAHKEDRIKFTSINPFPGIFISGDGRYVESDSENALQKRAAIFIGPEYGTLGRADIVAAAREARDLQFDVLVCCAFNYDAHSSEIDKLADLPILKARMNPDLHMADELKNTGAGNLFVVFGEPDIDFIEAEDGKMQVKINGVDVFHPSKGEVVSGGPESIAAWFIDTDYNEESFFVRHAYFLGANDPYKQLKSALKAEIDEEAWESLYRDISRPFSKPETGRIAVKVINHLGDEVMKVFNVD